MTARAYTDPALQARYEAMIEACKRIEQHQDFKVCIEVLCTKARLLGKPILKDWRGRP